MVDRSMGTNVAIQDAATRFRLELHKNIYIMESFHASLKSFVAATLPIYQYETCEYVTKIRITINKNSCSSLPGYSHTKEFYANIVGKALIDTLRTVLSNFTVMRTPMDSPNLLYSINLLNSVLTYINTDPTMLYRLFDITPILDNQIVIYL